MVLVVIKGVLGLVLGSVALLADAVHSLSDVGSSFILILGLVWARKPRDSRHPFGHGRVELVTALVMAVLLIVLGIEFARFGIARIIEPRIYNPTGWMILAVIGTLLLKHWVALFARSLAQATGSQALSADYWHHVADVLSTVLVIIALCASRLGWPGADGWVGLGVAGFIVYTGISTAINAIHPLLGEAPEPHEVERIEEASLAVTGVRGVHDLILHKYGDDRVVSLHIEVDADRSALAVHGISERVEKAVEQVIGGKAIVHVDPVDRSHPQYTEAEELLNRVVEGNTDLTEFHDLRVDGPTHQLHLSVDVVAVVGTREAAYPDIEARVRSAILDTMEGIDEVDVTVETGYHPK